MDSLAMRKTIYSTAIDTVYAEAIVADVHLFIINPTLEAELDPWVREEFWNEMGDRDSKPARPVRQKSHDADIIDIEDLRFRRGVTRGAHHG